VEVDRKQMIYGKDKLVESIDAPIDVSVRQTKEVLEFKKDKFHYHNQTWKDHEKLLKEENEH
jgi:hypothetical protein